MLLLLSAWLPLQVHAMIQKLAQFTDVQAALVVGGLSLQARPQCAHASSLLQRHIWAKSALDRC